MRVWIRSCCLALALATVLTACSPPGDAVQAEVVVFAVRHAEKVDASEDPPLSPAGIERANVLATTLRSARLTGILSSDYRRTRDTAAPLAARLGLKVELYDARNLDALARRLLTDGGRYLVVGHSNTTPQLVRLLGGDPVSPIEEASEYDRLYVLGIGRDRRVSSALVRYGAPYVPGDGATPPR